MRIGAVLGVLAGNAVDEATGVDPFEAWRPRGSAINRDSP
jgi:hypothetical protein